MRLFIAIEIPNRISKNLENARKDLTQSNANIRWVAQDNRHLTLHFLGDVGKDKLTALEEAMEDGITGKVGFTLKLKGIGVFPGWHNPRVIWAGVSQGREHVSALHKSLAQTLIRVEPALASKKEQFTPHVTLGRFKDSVSKQSIDKLHYLAGEYDDIEFGEILVDGVSLIESKLTSSGPIYTSIYRC